MADVPKASRNRMESNTVVEVGKAGIVRSVSSPLPLWERVDQSRASAIETGEGSVSVDRDPSSGSHLAMRTTFSHKGRGEGSPGQTSSFPRHDLPEFCNLVVPLLPRGRRESRALTAPVDPARRSARASRMPKHTGKDSRYSRDIPA